jgi:hypothetical protein
VFGADPTIPTGIDLSDQILVPLAAKRRALAPPPLLVFIDACRSPSGALTAGYAKPDINPDNSFLFFSSGPNKPTAIHSGFTKSLTRRISAPGERLDSIAVRVKDDVKRETNDQQIPQVFKSSGDFIFRPPAWQIQPIRSTLPATVKPQWHDVAWLGRDGWLGGVLEWGGAGGPIGKGVLIRTTDGGRTWNDMTKSIQSGAGKFNFGGFPYQWDQVGPILSFSFTQILSDDGTRPFEGTMATATGIYRTLYNPGTPNSQIAWKRLTASPDTDSRYSEFSGLAFVEHEVYAVGWPGIAHAWGRGRQWEFQKQTMSYYIAAIAAYGPRPTPARDSPRRSGNGSWCR